jgi:hypothetical protein
MSAVMTSENVEQKLLLNDATEIATIGDDTDSQMEQMLELETAALPDSKRFFFQEVEAAAKHKCKHRTYNGLFQVYSNGGLLCELDPNTGDTWIVTVGGAKMRLLDPLNLVDLSELCARLRGFAPQIGYSASNYTVPANVQRLPQGIPPCPFEKRATSFEQYL